ncbi:MAG: SUF system Fe-S cluster assembly protein [Gammaproteobacteria bacterium]
MNRLTEWIQKSKDRPLENPAMVRARIIEAMREIYDPEIPVNIYDLGLIYRVDVDEAGYAEVDMTLTTPGCPVAQTFPGTVEQKVSEVEGVTAARVELVWDPPWTQDNMSDEVKLELGLL